MFLLYQNRNGCPWFILIDREREKFKIRKENDFQFIKLNNYNLPKQFTIDQKNYNAHRKKIVSFAFKKFKMESDLTESI